MATRRAGGHIDRGDGRGWVLDDSPIPDPPKPKPHADPVPGPTRVGGWVLASEAEAEPEPVAIAARPKKTAAKRATSKET